MYYVGIDPSADTFTASLYAEKARKGKAQTLPNSPEGVDTLLEGLRTLGCTRANTLICVENTGVFSETLLYLFHQAGWMLAVAEPLRVHRAFEHGAAKTDEIDSLKIAEYASRYHDKLRLWEPNEAIVEQIRSLLATRELLVKQKTALSNTRQALGRRYIQTPVANTSVEKLIEQVRVQIENIQAEIKRLIDGHPTLASTVALLLTAPGVGRLLAAHLLVISGGFSRPLCYRKLARYLGIAPLPHQSGTSVRGKPRSRGYGPKVVRKLLHLAARSLVTHQAEFKAYYARQVAQNKPKTLVLNNVANRLLRRVCSMIKNNQPYIEGYVSVNPRLLAT